jgi:hypothetical protein
MSRSLRRDDASVGNRFCRCRARRAKRKCIDHVMAWLARRNYVILLHDEQLINQNLTANMLAGF